MPRIPRNCMETSFFHIMVQGIEKKYIFNENEDIEKYIDLLKKKNEEIIIIAYCIMNNHGHILIKAEDSIYMEKWMQKVNTSFARYYNKKYDRVGYVFRNRYKTQQIRTIKHLYACLKYIHDNPVKAGICDKPDKYIYSSYMDLYNGNKENIDNMLKILIDNKAETVKDNHIKEQEEFIFMEYEQSKTELCKERVYSYIAKNNLDTLKLKKDKDMLRVLLQDLRENYKVSYREMEKIIGISRETIRQLIKNNINNESR